MKNIICILVVSLFLSGCATVFLPRKQAVNFTVSNEKSEIYIDKEQVSEGGTSFKLRVARNSTAKQIVAKTPGYKDNYLVMVPTRKAIGYYIYQIANIPLLYGLLIDAQTTRCKAYDRHFNIDINNKLINKAANNKYVDISSIKLSIKDASKDIKSYSIDYTSNNLIDRINEEEAKREERDAKYEAKLAKRKKKKGLDDFEEKGIKYDDTKFSYDVYKTLKSTGFVDTTNTFFTDYNNSLLLEGSITKINYYRINANFFAQYNKAKIFLTWYVKNNYGEILDSINTSEFSGDYAGDFTYFSNASSAEIERVKDNFFNSLNTMLADAINISYLNLHKNKAFTKHLNIGGSDLANKDANLNLALPKSFVSEKTEGGQATVIVKTKDGHGSGFAISEDGYILTNYHVIAGRIENKLNDAKIITSTGEELTSTIVRYNKYKDIALLKVNKKFDKAFKLPASKTFTNFQDVFTIGAPKSVELGQSISTGVISNERKTNSNDLIQLNMSVNSGNSGGPVFDSKGTLHGVIVSKAIGKNTEGICFAIPAYLVAQYLNISFN